jgi:hypothetical protein
MSESMGHRHIRITRSSGLGVTRTEVEITEVTNQRAIRRERIILSAGLNLRTYDYDYAHSSQHVHDSDGEECFDTSVLRRAREGADSFAACLSSPADRSRIASSHDSIRRWTGTAR